MSLAGAILISSVADITYDTVQSNPGGLSATLFAAVSTPVLPQTDSAKRISHGIGTLVSGAFEWFGDIGAFCARLVKSAIAPPYEGRELLKQMDEIGAKSFPLVALAGAAIGVVLSCTPAIALFVSAPSRCCRR